MNYLSENQVYFLLSDCHFLMSALYWILRLESEGLLCHHLMAERHKHKVQMGHFKHRRGLSSLNST